MEILQSLQTIDREAAALAKVFLSDTDRLFVSSDRYLVLPGFCDVHVHFREPGFSYKETIQNGSLAAAAGGYTAVCTMPNLNPVPDCLDSLNLQRELVARDAVIDILPYGAITVGEMGEALADLDALAPFVCGFSDDGRGVQNEEMMRSAMLRIKQLGKVLAAHCEDNSLLHGGYIHDGDYAKAHGHRGICSESEWGQVERDLKLAKETGVAYHVCHISTKESVALIRRAKAEGVDVTCETAPHYLLLTDQDLKEEGRFKMNPPVRSEEDRQALLAGLLDGTVDMIATDHAPHSEEEKSRGLAQSPFGIVGLETAFPLLYTKLVKPGILPLDTLLDRMCIAPRRRFGIGQKREDFTVFRIDRQTQIDPARFHSLGKSTPFAGETVSASCVCTVKDGRPIYRAEA